MKEIKILAVTGMVGCGFPEASMKEGMRRRPDLVGMDAGSTDGGPSFLGDGTTGLGLGSIKRDLSLVVSEVINSKTPLIIGSAGTAGAEPQLKLFLEIMREIRKEKGLRKFKVAVIHSEMDKEFIKQKIRQGRVRPMPGLIPELTDEEVDRSVRIVGQMGVTPYMKAMDYNADIILAGRSCDTAIYAALPLKEGFDPGPAFHAAKIMECGAYATEPGISQDSLFATFREHDFILDTVNPEHRCTPLSVAAHTLYENGHPSMFSEPDGTVDCSKAMFEQVTPTAVRGWNTKFIPAVTGKATIKLEGAALTGYRTICVAGVHDPMFIKHIDYIEDAVIKEVESFLGTREEHGYSVHFRVYGKNAVLQSLETHPSAEHEVGIIIDVVARTQHEATSFCAQTRQSMLHIPYPERKTVGGNIAFAFSPLDNPIGKVYEFNVFHLMEVDDLNDLFPIEVVEVG